MPTRDNPAAIGSDANFLEGGGDMGALMRSIRWANTPLGPVVGWSPALRTLVGVLLRNRFPMLIMWGPSFIQLYNDAYRPILGDKHPRSMGQACAECWAEIWPVISSMIEEPFRGEPATWADDIELLISRRGFLEECHFKLAYNPVPDETVQPTGIGGVLAPAAETTEKVYAERQLRVLRELAMQTADEKTAEKACVAAAATLRSAARDVPFALFYLLDDRGQSAQLAGSFGFARAEDLPASTWPLDAVVGERRIEVLDDLPRRFGEHLPVNEWNAKPMRAMVLPLASPDQPRVYGFLVAGTSPHRTLDQDYRTFFELAAAQVVTAIRNARAYQEERKRAEALAALDQAKTAFFSNVSHEFRTPLTLMLGPVEDGLDDSEQPLPPRQRERQVVVHRSCMRLQKLVNTLLDFSRIEAGRAQAHFQPTDLSAVTANLASSFRSLVEKAGLALTVECPPLDEPTYVDRDMYEKIVLNLLSNAFKFTFEGGIRVSLETEGGSVRLVVADTGTGVPEAELPHLFERFHRVEGAKGRSFEGSGIGLALVQELAKLHGGAISVESRLGAGSRFIVSFPRGAAHLPPDRIESAPSLAPTALGADAFLDEAFQWTGVRRSPQRERSANELPPSVAGNIVLVDDNADMREYVCKLLIAEGWHVDTAEDGEAALQHIKTRAPDLVLTDVMMPKVDGFELLRALRRDPGTRLVPVILLSARAGEEARVEGLDAGADDYLVKPFTARELLARVRTNLNTARTRKEAMRLSEVARATAEEERKKAEKLAKELTLADVRKDEFLAMLAHELRNPMAAISMALSMLERTEGDAAKTAKHRETAGRQMGNLVRLVDDLLDVSRITRGAVELRKEVVDLAAIVQNALTATRPTIEARGHELSVTLVGGSVWIEGDATRIEQVAVNLLTNAAKYTEPGGRISVRVARQVSNDASEAVLSVCDSGRGIPADMLDQVFDMFVQVSPSLDRTTGGLGMGLTLVRRLVEMHGGDVVVHSDGVGKGSEFVVRLPLANRTPVHIAENGGEPQPQVAASSRKQRILVVEDSDDLRDTLEAFLEDLGHEVWVARDGLEGAACLLDLRPDVALIDVGLPGIDGYELARRVRAALGGEGLYLVALTGYDGPEARTEAQRAGFDVHLAKPVDINELARVVSRPTSAPWEW